MIAVPAITNHSARLDPKAPVRMSHGPVVLVTGASQGIGEATASLLADEGYRVYGTARVPSAERTRSFEMLELDVRVDSSVLSCVSTVLKREGRIDILVNNAGVGMVGAVEETTMTEARDLYETNVFGMGRMVAAVLPGMREQRSGQIINLGAVAAHLPVPYHAWLVSSKAAVGSYSDALRSAGTTIGAGRPKDGGWSSPNQACWSGTRPPGGPMPPPSPNTRCSRP
jgi:NADP-dependent 3-hydroxy acid dehydrogenase YdfG